MFCEFGRFLSILKIILYDFTSSFDDQIISLFRITFMGFKDIKVFALFNLNTKSKNFSNNFVFKRFILKFLRHWCTVKTNERDRPWYSTSLGCFSANFGHMAVRKSVKSSLSWSCDRGECGIVACLFHWLRHRWLQNFLIALVLLADTW